nr:MAG TPA: hypothetical protein [Bacteriophage sp.]
MTSYVLYENHNIREEILQYILYIIRCNRQNVLSVNKCKDYTDSQTKSLSQMFTKTRKIFHK